MALPAIFNAELALVSGGVTVTDNPSASGYGLYEWSYSESSGVYTILGGSAIACEHGACHLLDAMGFRWYGQTSNFIVRPASATLGLTEEKQQFVLPETTMQLSYSNSWDGIYASSRTALDAGLASFQRMNGVYVSNEIYRVGHIWNSIITYPKLATFWSAPENANLLMPLNGSATTKTLNLSVTGDDYTRLVNACAAYSLDSGRIQIGVDRSTLEFDPADSDPQNSNIVFPFTANVCAKIRAGSDAVGTIGAKTGVANCYLGIYAYAGHRRPPDGDFSDYIYTQVALGFNSTNYTLEDLVRIHAQKAATIKIRDYWDLPAWHTNQPMSTNRGHRTYPAVLDKYIAAAANNTPPKTLLGNRFEHACNWLNSCIYTRALILKMRTGTVDFQAVQDEVIAAIFNDDPAVHNLYDLWHDPDEKWHFWNLKKSVDFVKAMQNNWYKPMFKHMMVIFYEFLTLPLQQNATNNPTTFKTSDDPFWVKFPTFAKHIVAVRDYGITQAYAWLRREANGAVDGVAKYPELAMFNRKITYDSKTGNFTVGEQILGSASWRKATIRLINDNGDGTGYIWVSGIDWVDNEVITGISSGASATINGASTRADWWENPVLPTDADFNAVSEALDNLLQREDDLDDPDLVLVHNITPLAGETAIEATSFQISGGADLIFIGPGVVTQTGTYNVYGDDGEPTGETEEIDKPETYPAGLHIIRTISNTINVSHTGGHLFLDAFYQVRRDAVTGGGEYWIYCPTRCADNFAVWNQNRTRLKDATHTPTSVDILPTSNPSEYQNLGPGNLMYDNGNSANNTFGVVNGNRYMALKKSTILIPRVLAEEDFLAVGKIIKA
jgi:hypothetical protein